MTNIAYLYVRIADAPEPSRKHLPALHPHASSLSFHNKNKHFKIISRPW